MNRTPTARRSPSCTTKVDRSCWIALVLMLVGGWGCERGPARRVPPAIDPAAAAAAAITQLDRNADQLLDADELQASPGLQAAHESIDQDSDDRLSAAEIAARIASWSAGRVALVSVKCAVWKGGQPYPGAEVRFSPEPFLEPHIKPAYGVSDAYGNVALSLEGETLPGLMHCGLYRVTISRKQGTKELIPARFNRDSHLGEEITEGSGRRKVGIVYEL